MAYTEQTETRKKKRLLASQSVEKLRITVVWLSLQGSNLSDVTWLEEVDLKRPSRI